jgi:hypothetical protein
MDLTTMAMARAILAKLHLEAPFVDGGRPHMRNAGSKRIILEMAATIVWTAKVPHGVGGLIAALYALRAGIMI